MAKILVVDDLEVNRALLVTLVQHLGHEALEAADGAEALLLARALHPALIISDVLMPTMDGYEFVRRLREDPDIAGTEVIFYSAHYREREVRHLAEACGVTRILIKPCEPQAIMHAIDQALAHASDPVPLPDAQAFDHAHLQLMTDKLSEKNADLEYANSRLAALTDLQLHLASERDPRALLDKVCRGARDLIGARYAVLGAQDPYCQETFFCTSGLARATQQSLSEPRLDRGVLGQVWAQGQPYRVTDLHGDMDTLGLPADYPPVQMALVVPLASLERRYGWICLADKLGAEAFSEADEFLLATLAAQVGRIYENGNLYAETQRHAQRLRESEQQLRQLAENIHDVFFLIDVENGKGLYVSPAYETIWGRSCESAYADPESWIEAVHPDDFAATYENYRKGLRSGTYEYEFRIVRPDGSIRWIQSRGFPILDPSGKLVRVTGVAEDVTESVELRQQLRAREAALSRAQMLARLTHVISGESGIFESWPPTLPTMIGRDSAGVPRDARGWMALIHPDDRPLFREKALEAHTNNVRTELDYRLLRPDGSGMYLRHVMEPIAEPASPGSAVRWFNTIQDITEEKLAQEALHESDRRFREMMASVQLASVMLDCNANITYCNDFLLQLTGWRREEVLGQNWYAMFMPSPPPGVVLPAFMDLLDTRPDAWHIQNEMMTRSGARRQVRWSNTRLRSASGEIVGSASIGEDVTDQVEAQRKIQRLNHVYAVLSGINTLIVRVHGRDELFREACRIAVQVGDFRMAWIGLIDGDKLRPIAAQGVSADFLETAWDNFPLDAEAPQGHTLAARAVRRGAALCSNNLRNDASIAFRDKLLESGSQSLAALPLVVAGEVAGVLILSSVEVDFFDAQEMALLSELAGDIAFAMDHLAKADRLNYLAYYDEITGLPNRTLFLERISQQLGGRGGENNLLALALIDIERFHIVNDTLGRQTGDQLLQLLAQRLEHNAAGLNTVARVGVNCFGVAIHDARDAEGVALVLEQVLRACFGTPFHLQESSLRMAGKGGIALYPMDGKDAEDLLRNAEAALKRAKDSAEMLMFYTPEMNTRVAEALNLESKLRTALDLQQFVLHYQPKVCLKSGRLVGAEALIRWNDPEQGLVPPAHFIPLLEETGMIYEVGRWALHQALQDYLRWRAAGHTPVRIAVNVSPLQLRHPGFVADIAHIVDQDAYAADGLELEITESQIMEDVQRNIANLAAIRSMGVSIALDDFGTGYSSLGYLAKLPADTLKIDRSFVLAMGDDEQGKALVATIIHLAHSLKLQVVAEGVETEEQAQILRALECDHMQGYLFSKPVPAEVFEAVFLRAAGPD